MKLLRKNMQATFVRVFGTRDPPGDMKAQLAFFQSERGQRYRRFEVQIERAWNKGILGLMSHRPNTAKKPSLIVLRHRVKLLQLSWDWMLLDLRFQQAKRRHADVTGFADFGLILANIGWRQGADLDRLSRHYKGDLDSFRSFNDSKAGKRLIAVMSAHTHVIQKVTQKALASFESAEEKKFGAEWRRALKN